MNRMKIVAQETLIKQIKSGSFWFMIIFPIVMMGISMGVGALVGNSGENMAIVADEEIATYFKNDPNIDFKISSEDKLDKLIDDKEVSSYAKIRKEDGVVIADYMPGSGSMSKELALQNILNQIQSIENTKSAKLSADQQKALATMPIINKISDKKADNKSFGMVIYFVFLFLMYMITLTFINVVLTETATEKGTKMIEFIFSSVKPGDYFAGKMIGNFLAVLIQIVTYIIFGVIGFNIAKTKGLLEMIPFDMTMGGNMTAIIIEMIALFLLGIFIFLIAAGMLGSFATKIEDAGKMGSPLIFLIIILFFLAFTLINKGDLMVSKILSYLPFASTFFMPLRLLNGYASLGQGLISIAILLISILLMYRFGEKVYKKNILNYSSDTFFTRKRNKE